MYLCLACSPRYVQLSPDQLRVRRKTLYEEIATQIEFYFSENNFPFDKHLRSLVDSDGYVSVKDLLGFPKLKTLTTVGLFLFCFTFIRFFFVVKDSFLPNTHTHTQSVSFSLLHVLLFV